MRASGSGHAQGARKKDTPRGLEPRTARVIALGAWGLAILSFLLVADFSAMDRPTLAALAVAFCLPAIFISLGLLVTAATWSLRQETQDLQGMVDELRRAVLQHESAATPLSPAAQSDLDRLKDRQQQTETRLTMFFSQRGRVRKIDPDSAPPPDGEDQADFLDGAGPTTTVSEIPPADLIRALNFPENEKDQPGFDALRLALADPRLAPLIRAAQDVLTRLAQEGIYMDDLRPDRARPEFWRAFAEGQRGQAIAPLGGIRDRSCLAITSGRMRSDPEFRASVHLFLREFDRVFARFAARADDSQISALADTRSARAFMLLGRVSGVFS